ncbi:MAG: YeeE/YedE family protein [Bacteroidales bacterium]|nr:YeeE/YedE family protein [Bacteroidales bacterium]
MGPILTSGDFAAWVSLLIAFLIGIGFGFALEQAGFSSSRKLAGMFYGYDATVLKVFFTAAIVAMVGARILNALDLLDMSLVFHNQFYIHASLIGGIIMGAGFVMGGFCPGTGISALAIGKIDALFFLLGGAVGAFIFAESYGLLEKIHMAGYRGPVKLSEAIGLSDGVFILIVVVIAAGMFWLAEKAEKRFARPEITSEL